MQTLNKQKINSSIIKISKLNNKINELGDKMDLVNDVINSLEKQQNQIQNQISEQNQLIKELENQYDLEDIFTNKDVSILEIKQEKIKNTISSLQEKLSNIESKYYENSHKLHDLDNKIDELSDKITQEKEKIELFLFILDRIDMTNEKFINQINELSGKEYVYMDFVSKTFVEHDNYYDEHSHNEGYYESEQILTTKQLKEKLEKYNNKVEIRQFYNFIEKNFSKPYIFDNDVIKLSSLKNSLFNSFDNQIFDIFYDTVKKTFEENKDYYLKRYKLDYTDSLLLDVLESLI